MPRQEPHHVSMRRIVIVAVLAIILPSLVLTLIGLKLTLDLKSQLERSLAEQYASSVRDKAEEIEAQVASLEERVKRAADVLDPARIPSTLDALRRQSPIVEELFLLDEQLHMAYPAEGPPAPTAAETLLWSEPLPSAARRPEAGEEPAGQPGTLEALRRYRDRSLSPAARARATQVIAALLFRQHQDAEAIAEYRRLLDVDDVAILSPSLALLARYQLAAAQRRLGRAPDALASLLDLYADLTSERTGVPDADRIAYFKGRIRQDIESLLGRTDAPRTDSLRYSALVEEEQSRAATARFLAYLRRFVLPRLELQAPSLRADEAAFRHLWDDEFADEPYAIAYGAVRAPDGGRRILGFKLNLGYVRGKLLPSALSTSRWPQVAFVAADRKGAPLFGEKGRQPFAASAPFPKIFQTWRLGLVEREPADLRRLALYNVLLFAIVNGLMILAILVGVAITLRGTAHELDLSRLKSEFVSNVSHELKTPLALIRMFAETLELGRVTSPEKAQEYYSIITRESERLTQLINNVLDFSRIESGRKTYELRLDDLGEVVRDTLRAYSYELTKQGFTVETDIPDGLPETLMDRNSISLALLNLLSNAVKYSKDDRRIRVACSVRPELADGRAEPAEARNGVLTLEVTDHGIGIDPSEHDRIFEKFYRGRDEAVRATRGSGLGLAIVRHSIEAHGGSVALTSEKGHGSTFTISLPIRKTLTDGMRK